MNFTSFTGSSRKTRYVNLSGQKASNPFAGSSFRASSALDGASLSVAHAQAERQQRQLERDRLKAALRIQRFWRGHRARRRLRDQRRELFDHTMWHGPPPAGPTAAAANLALILVQPSRADDRARLALLLRHLLQTQFQAFWDGHLSPTRLVRLGRLLLDVLEQERANRSADSDASLFLRAFLDMIELHADMLRHVVAKYYDVLAGYFHQGWPGPKPWDLLRRALAAPLAVAQTCSALHAQAAYREFAFTLLARPHLALLEENMEAFCDSIDTEPLAKAILDDESSRECAPETETGRLWLLAHFIALQRAASSPSISTFYLQALRAQLSSFSALIRSTFAVSDPRDGPVAASLPSYVEDQLGSLVTKDMLPLVLDAIALNQGPSSRLDRGTVLAGYILTLLLYFPSHGDEVRMRLYLADFATAQGSLPATRFFWETMKQTSIFSVLSSDDDATLPVLRREPSSVHPPMPSDDVRWDQEWQSILLFLELFTFVLRLADDDDFFHPCTDANAASTSRLRASGLAMADLERLTLFLKHLGFDLYYHAAEIQEPVGPASPADANVPGSLPPKTSSGQVSSSVADAKEAPPASSVGFAITTGIDFTTLRNAVTAAMRMLYERDSRRSFLPPGHWLMTSKFDMEGFLSAVVLEEQHQRELNEAHRDDEDGTDDDADAAEDDDDDDMDMDGHGYDAYTATGHRLSHTALTNRYKRQQRQTAREHLRAAIAPKLEVLRNIPYVVPFATRVQIFRQFVHLDQQRRRGGNVDPDHWRMWMVSQTQGRLGGGRWSRQDHLERHHAEIHRGQVFRDGLHKFFPLNEGLKEPIQITFVDEWGMPEAGIDGGGVTKEFLTGLIRETFAEGQDLFVTTKSQAYYPNPYALDQLKEDLRRAGRDEGSMAYRESLSDHLRQYEFLGRIIGKCMYEGILVDIVFAGFFLLRWSMAGSESMHRATINDLHELDEGLYQGMLRLKNYAGDVRDLELDFTIEDQVSRPGEPVRTVTRNLCAGGDTMTVTNENRLLYITYVARHRLVAQSYAQTRAFLRGLGLLIDPAWLGMFNQSELQRLVGGDSSDMDIEDLRAHTQYSGVFDLGPGKGEHETVQLFWEVMHELDGQERRDVLKFVTSTPRAPLLGFAQLRPAFTLRDSGGDEERLPSASTCVNLLKLPRYRHKSVLKQKLLYAVQSNAGFDLS